MTSLLDSGRVSALQDFIVWTGLELVSHAHLKDCFVVTRPLNYGLVSSGNGKVRRALICTRISPQT